ncbi:unnamed protein product [Amoebophrya sp. A25]|nr:unnamed protein product [Amoebophrya sp. A25]|eukprot:GSA25T00000125001.1
MDVGVSLGGSGGSRRFRSERSINIGESSRASLRNEGRLPLLLALRPCELGLIVFLDTLMLLHYCSALTFSRNFGNDASPCSATATSLSPNQYPCDCFSCCSGDSGDGAALAVPDVTSAGSADVCTKCALPQGPRYRHCHSCERCHPLRDWHCPFLGTCIGAWNVKFFICWLLFLSLGLVVKTYVALRRTRNLLMCLTAGAVPTIQRRRLLLLGDEDETIGVEEKKPVAAVPRRKAAATTSANKKINMKSGSPVVVGTDSKKENTSCPKAISTDFTATSHNWRTARRRLLEGVSLSYVVFLTVCVLSEATRLLRTQAASGGLSWSETRSVSGRARRNSGGRHSISTASSSRGLAESPSASFFQSNFIPDEVQRKLGSNPLCWFVPFTNCSRDVARQYSGTSP